MERLSREDALCAALPLLSPMMALLLLLLLLLLVELLLLRLVETVRGGCCAEAEAADEVSWLSLIVGGLRERKGGRGMK